MPSSCNLPCPKTRSEWIEANGVFSKDGLRISTNWDAVINDAVKWAHCHVTEQCCDFLKKSLPDSDISDKVKEFLIPTPPDEYKEAFEALDRLSQVIPEEDKQIITDLLSRAKASQGG